MTEILIGTVALALINFAYKGAGPALLVDREPSPTATELITAMSPALLAGLITVELTGPRWGDVDWTTLPGLAAAAIAYRKRAPDLACVVIAVTVTAGLRSIAS